MQRCKEGSEVSDTPETDAFFAEWTFTSGVLAKSRLHAEKLERERDEAKEQLSSTHRWIERNHADGFIDSLSYSQNLERVADNWYGRLDIVERERDEAREERDDLKQELEIVTARLHGKKHPLDNGIPERHEVYIFKNGKYELDT